MNWNFKKRAKAQRSLLASNNSHLAFTIFPGGPKAEAMFIRGRKNNRLLFPSTEINVQRYHYVTAKVKRVGKSQKREDE